MFTGPVVTGSGPHAGDAKAERFYFFIPDVVRIHSINMWIFLAVVVVLLFRLARQGTPADIMRRGRRLLAMIVVQGAIGYTQYELGIPEWLVALHIAGATAVVGLTVWFHLGLSAPVEREASVPVGVPA
jgi:cytochrome c oxidase assembly protein subunit 15